MKNSDKIDLIEQKKYSDITNIPNKFINKY